MALGLGFPPLPSPFDDGARLVARRLLEEHVYGPVSKPDAIAFSDWIGIGDGIKVANSPFPLLWASPLESRATIVALSFTPVESLIDHDQVWPLRRLIEAGISIAVACYNDIEPDDPKESSGRAIAKWAQGLMQIRRWLASDSRVDASRIFALGHSRLGKTALLASAFDGRFAGVVAIQSGCGGAAPSRTSVGETVGDITRVFPHWFTPEFSSYAGREEDLPIDQHWLLALCASRPVLLCNAEDDVWANPAGQHEMLALVAEAYGEPLPPMALGTTVGSRLAHFDRQGTHQVTQEDWQAILAWLNRV